MRYLLVLMVLLAAGVGAWQIGNRLSTDAVGMGVGLVFGVLSGVPAALLVLGATGGRRRDDDGSAYDDGYQAGIRETNALARGTRPQPTAPALIVVERPVPKYTAARPFDIVPAGRCDNWQRCPDCGLPLTPDEHCADWCGVPARGRRFLIVGEVE